MPSVLTLIRIPPPENIAQYAEQLAQIETPVGIFEAYSNREHRQVIIEGPIEGPDRSNSQWWIQSDTEPILRSIQHLCPSLGFRPVVTNLRIVSRHDSRDADEELTNALHGCTWDDYICDQLAFTVDLSPGSGVPDMTHDDRCGCNACLWRQTIT